MMHWPRLTIAGALLLLLALTGGCAGGGGSNEPDLIEETKREIARLQNAPVPAGNVRITITRLESERETRQSMEALLRYRRGKMSVRHGMTGSNGFHIFRGDDSLLAQLEAGQLSRQFASRTKQFITLMPGTEAGFESVMRRSVGWVAVIPIYRGSVIIDTLEERISGTGMRVRVHRATARGVEVSLIPYFYATERRGPQEIDELETRVFLEPGVPLVIAGNEAASDRAGWWLLGHGSRSSRRSVSIVIDAEVPPE